MTGAAGFIGSNLVEACCAPTRMSSGSTISRPATGATWTRSGRGRPALVALPVHRGRHPRPRRLRARRSTASTIVLHQAALGLGAALDRRPADQSHDSNVTGFLNMLEAARHAGVKRFVYAASSSTYGDEPNLPKRRGAHRQAAVALCGDQARSTRFTPAVYAAAYGFQAIGPALFQRLRPAPGPRTAPMRR